MFVEAKQQKEIFPFSTRPFSRMGGWKMESGAWVSLVGIATRMPLLRSSGSARDVQKQQNKIPRYAGGCYCFGVTSR